MTTVWKVVDDSDSCIQYNGEWDLASGDTSLFNVSSFVGDTLNQMSLTGSVFNNTLHEARVNDTSFSFKFNGELHNLEKGF